eukprot:Awhi_evm1s1156
MASEKAQSVFQVTNSTFDILDNFGWFLIKRTSNKNERGELQNIFELTRILSVHFANKAIFGPVPMDYIHVVCK